MTRLESLEHATALDAADPATAWRDEFVFPRRGGAEVAYLCGHSLGLQPRRARAAVVETLDAWAERAVEGHFDGPFAWYRGDERPAELLAALVGARPEEVAVANALTVNLHLLMASFFRPRGTRRKILIEGAAFPSDRYAVSAQLAWHGLDPVADLVEVAPDARGLVTTEAICAAIAAHAEELALVLIGGVHYLTGEAVDVGRIVRAGHDAGAVVGLDLAHAAGNVALSLHHDDVDFAAWCTYKYLNAGPGAVGALFVHERHGASTELVRLAGWWGNDPDRRFAMDEEVRFVAARGARGWKISNPPMVSVASLRGSLEVFAAVGMPALVARSRELTGALEALLADVPGIELVTPADPARRGAMLTVRVPAPGAALVAALSGGGVVADHRPPDIVRLAPVPLYCSRADVWRAVQTLEKAMAEVG